MQLPNIDLIHGDDDQQIESFNVVLLIEIPFELTKRSQSDGCSSHSVPGLHSCFSHHVRRRVSIHSVDFKTE